MKNRKREIAELKNSTKNPRGIVDSSPESITMYVELVERYMLQSKGEKHMLVVERREVVGSRDFYSTGTELKNISRRTSPTIFKASSRLSHSLAARSRVR